MANKNNQIKIVKTLTQCFNKTLCLIRYPNLKAFKKYKVGFHDDSFCFSTLKNGKENFLYLMEKAKLKNQYKCLPNGGEVRPEEQATLNLTGYARQNYFDCVKQTHCSWLVNQGAFEDYANENLVKKMSAALGYDFFVYDVKLYNKFIKFKLKNVGVAPLYHNFNLVAIYFKNNSQIYTHKICELKNIDVNCEYNFKINMIECDKIVLSGSDNIGQKLVFSNSHLDKFGNVLIYI